MKQNLTGAEADVKSYLENSEEYLKLKIFKVLMGMVTATAQLLLVGAVSLVALFILSFAIAYAIGSELQNDTLGFGIVGIFYALVALLCYFLRDKLNKPLLKKFSKNYFD
ncbi:hypothetical protein ACFQZJ_07635 [Maribacter chungangensis]|uniref:Phage holin family protein n=1 Tax=Maribacter chungangensis TaxID=1069117 RepID=A0ABW3B398_9FLAO